MCTGVCSRVRVREYSSLRACAWVCVCTCVRVCGSESASCTQSRHFCLIMQERNMCTVFMRSNTPLLLDNTEPSKTLPPCTTSHFLTHETTLPKPKSSFDTRNAMPPSAHILQRIVILRPDLRFTQLPCAHLPHLIAFLVPFFASPDCLVPVGLT